MFLLGKKNNAKFIFVKYIYYIVANKAHLPAFICFYDLCVSIFLFFSLKIEDTLYVILN